VLGQNIPVAAKFLELFVLLLFVFVETFFDLVLPDLGVEITDISSGICLVPERFESLDRGLVVLVLLANRPRSTNWRSATAAQTAPMKDPSGDQTDPRNHDNFFYDLNLLIFSSATIRNSPRN
jgi:hypothetical protein